MEEIIYEFENTTKFPLMKLLEDYASFMTNSFPEVQRYFSGEISSIDNRHMELLKDLTKRLINLNEQFDNFSSKFSLCGFWELSELVEELNTVIEKINKFPKFLRTSKTKFGYQPFIQVDSTIGGGRTMEDVSDSIKNQNGEDQGWTDLMIQNDLEEGDWEIDELKPITVFVNNKIDIVVTTILDQPIGERIYGKDFNRKISFVDNDLSIVEYRDNLEQKCVILLDLNRGDIPEFPLMGKNLSLTTGNSFKQILYPVIAKDIEDNFLQNDLFESVSVDDFSFGDGNVMATCSIKTKYDYKTTKTSTI